MKFKRTLFQENKIIHKFMIERDITNINLIKCNQLYYNDKNQDIIKTMTYYNKIKLYYDKKYSILSDEINFFDLKYKKILYNYNRVNDFNVNNYTKMLNDRVIHYDILNEDYKKYFKSDNIDDFLRVYFDIFLEIQNEYFGKKL